MLWQMIWAPAEIVLNRIVALDESARVRLSALRGKVLAVDLVGMPRMALAFGGDAIRVVAPGGSIPDVTLSASIASLVSGTGGAYSTKDGRASDIAISGDVSTIRALKEWTDNFSVDWEAHISAVIGPELARPVARALANVQVWLRGSADSLRIDVEEFVKHEVNWVPVSAEIDVFASDVAALRTRADGLAARVQRLHSAVSRRVSA